MAPSTPCRPPLTHGATLVLQGRFEPGEALDLIERHACTAIYTLPAMTNALLAHPAFEPRRTASLRTGVTIGAPQDVIKAATQLGAAEICNIYGSTESYGNCCVTPASLAARAARRAVRVRRCPACTCAFAIRRRARACKPGEVGQIEVKGYLTRGYAGASARHTAEAFTPDGYFMTGDLGAVAAGRRHRVHGASLRDDQALGHQRLAGRGGGGAAAARGRGARGRDGRRRSRSGRDHRRLRRRPARCRAHEGCAARPLPHDDCRATRFPIGCTCARPCRRRPQASCCGAS